MYNPAWRSGARRCRAMTVLPVNARPNCLTCFFSSPLNWILTASRLLSSPLLCSVLTLPLLLSAGETFTKLFFFFFLGGGGGGGGGGGPGAPPPHGSKGGGGCSAYYTSLLPLLSPSLPLSLSLSLIPMSPSLSTPLSLTTFNFIHSLIPPPTSPLPRLSPSASVVLHLPPASFPPSLSHCFPVCFLC